MVDGAGRDWTWRLTVSGRRRSAATAQQGIKRLFKQALLILLLLFIVWAILDKARDVRGAAELSAVQVSLGALRTAIVVDRMGRAAKFDQSSRPVTINPFLLLARLPINYAGEMALDDAVNGALKPGFWFFDKAQLTVGYRLGNRRLFFSTSGGAMLLFRTAEQELLIAHETYVWRGVAVK